MSVKASSQESLSRLSTPSHYSSFPGYWYQSDDLDKAAVKEKVSHLIIHPHETLICSSIPSQLKRVGRK